MSTSIVSNYPIFKHAFGDRYICARTTSSEMYSNFDTKSEIFSQSSQINLLDKLGSHPQSAANAEDN